MNLDKKRHSKPITAPFVEDFDSRDPNGISTLTRKVETFIPLRHADLVARLQDSLGASEDERRNYRRLCDNLSAIFHVEHLRALMRVEDIYAPLDPDSEAIEIVPISDENRDERVEQLFDQIHQVLINAHYHLLDQNELRHAIDVGFRWNIKLQVNFEVFDRIEIFARGWKAVKRTRRRWQRCFFAETIEAPEFHRLILFFRLKDSVQIDENMDPDAVYLKMFKDIPETDLEILLPGSKVKLSLIDQGKILVPNLSSAAMTVYKIFRVSVFLTIIATAWVIKGLLAIAVMVGYFTKGIFSYFNTRDKYQFGLTKSLYHKNLDNNAGVIYRIFNEAEEQEMCETVLTYSMIWKHCTGGGVPELEIEELAESYLNETVNFKIRFDVHEGLGRLARLGLASVDPEGRWTARPLDEAADILEQSWQQIFKKRV